jgi:valyl-tRNA synthetase
VILLSFAIFTKLISPYIPSFAKSLEEKFNYDWDSCKMFDLNSVELKEINYKTKVLMDIIDSFSTLRKDNNIQKHEHTDLYIQANPDFLTFLQENDLLIRSLMNI